MREVSLDQAVVIRVGFGAGEEVAEGRWTAALEPGEAEGGPAAPALPARGRAAAAGTVRGAPRRPRRGGRLRGTRAPRPRRPRRRPGAGAALQLRVALEAALAELEAWRGRRDLDQRLDELRDGREPVAAAANAALRGGLPEETIGDVERVLGRVEAAIRARAAAQ